MMSKSGKTNNYNTYIAQYLKKQKPSENRITEYNMRHIFLEKSYTKCGGETITRPFLKNIAYLWINNLNF